MPEMDGFTLYQKMCEIRKTGGIKMCFLTAFDRECHQEFKNRFIHLHERCFMHKPVKLQELVAVITAELEPQAANSQMSVIQVTLPKITQIRKGILRAKNCANIML